MGEINRVDIELAREEGRDVRESSKLGKFKFVVCVQAETALTAFTDFVNAGSIRLAKYVKIMPNVFSSSLVLFPFQLSRFDVFTRTTSNEKRVNLMSHDIYAAKCRLIENPSIFRLNSSGNKARIVIEANGLKCFDDSIKSNFSFHRLMIRRILCG